MKYGASGRTFGCLTTGAADPTVPISPDPSVLTHQSWPTQDLRNAVKRVTVFRGSTTKEQTSDEGMARVRGRHERGDAAAERGRLRGGSTTDVRDQRLEVSRSGECPAERWRRHPHDLGHRDR